MGVVYCTSCCNLLSALLPVAAAAAAASCQVLLLLGCVCAFMCISRGFASKALRLLPVCGDSYEFFDDKVDA